MSLLIFSIYAKILSIKEGTSEEHLLSYLGYFIMLQVLFERSTNMKKRRNTAQKMKKAGVILICFMLHPAAAYGSTAQDIAAASGGLIHVEQEALVSGITNEKTFVPAFEHAVAGALRVCDAAELVQYPFYYGGDGIVYRISADRVLFLLNRQASVQEWLEKHVPLIVPEGTDREKAVRMIFDYIVGNYSYDYDALTDFDSIHDSQGAYRIITTGRGICSGYSKLFRGMVEYLPFNVQGVVDYKSQDVSFVPVAIVSRTDECGGHEWNAIRNPADGLWYHYDLSETVMDGVERFGLSDINIVGDGKHGSVSQHIYEY